MVAETLPLVRGTTASGVTRTARKLSGYFSSRPATFRPAVRPARGATSRNIS